MLVQAAKAMAPGYRSVVYPAKLAGYPHNTAKSQKISTTSNLYGFLLQEL
jgi:hypothetical protein